VKLRVFWHGTFSKHLNIPAEMLLKRALTLLSTSPWMHGAKNVIPQRKANTKGLILKLIVV